ncbi:zinc finger FYVE domain-containing protein 1-like [Rhodnius prolixus]
MAFSLDKPCRAPLWPSNPNMSPAIMESLDSSSLEHRNTFQGKEVRTKKHIASLPDITLNSEFTSLTLGSADSNENFVKSFLLVDGMERLRVSSAEEFTTLLGCGGQKEGKLAPRVKVVSIVGNTGDGKSHTLNHLFFSGDEVFKTSAEQQSCTMGVWAALRSPSVVCLDTEGLLAVGVQGSDAAARARLLLKMLAVSDVMIFRTRSERLHEDMFKFIGSASRVYSSHLQSCLQSVYERSDMGGSLSALGPAIIIFHETRNTTPLRTNALQPAEDTLRETFRKMGLSIQAFSSLYYVGVQTLEPPTSFNELMKVVQKELANNNVRSPRNPSVIFNTIKALNDKFSGKIVTKSEILLDEYFTCPSECLSCKSRCQLSMGHGSTGQAHSSNNKCKYQHQYENIFYVCKTCHNDGKEVRVIPRYSSSSDGSWFEVITKYAWSGYVIECPNCGEIYRSRQYWYGNMLPEATAVRTEIHHVWPGMSCSGKTCQNSAQRVLDGVSYITDVVVSASATPTKALGSWVTDQIAPKYWKPNSEITKCHVCGIVFVEGETKHHCRNCGEGVCSKCSTHTAPVPDKGWYSPVRVCDWCFNPPAPQCQPINQVDENEVIPRKVSEAVVTTISTVAAVLNYPKSVIKETARPSYWVPDSEARECSVCSGVFTRAGGKAELHHCRGCGNAVCDVCSQGRAPVPHRGWNYPVRLCDHCVTKETDGSV